MEFTGTKTENCLRSAVSGEAQAAVLYDFFAEKAKKDGFEEIASIFRETAQNERAHAKIYLNYLKCIGITDENLDNSAKTELHEHSVMYPEFAKTARAEGFEDVAKTFEMVAKIESEHESRFRLLMHQVKNNAVFSKGTEVEWICRNCGHRHKSATAEEICPVCKHPKSFFEVVNSK